MSVPTRFTRLGLALCCAFLAACSSMGPATVSRDRFDYAASISDSWKQQMLLNLLKIRYIDAPVFLEVTSVISSYTLASDVNLSGQVAFPGRGDQYTRLGAGGRFEDRPTISYAPLSGTKFARSLLTPLSVSSIAYLIQAGYPADLVMRVTVNTVNGLENSFGGGGNPTPGNPKFFQLLEKMRYGQTSGRFGMRVKQTGDKQIVTLFLRPEPGAAREAEMRELLRLLGLDPDATEITVAYGSFPQSGKEIALLSRSMLQILTDLASYIDVPPEDAAEGRVYMRPRGNEELAMAKPLLRVHQGSEAPPDAYVATRYRNRWFWIDDRDVQTKGIFHFLMFMFALTETGETQAGAPVVTIPAR